MDDPLIRSVFPSSVTTSRVWPRRDAAAQRRLDVLRRVDGDDRRYRGHHLARLLLVQVEDAGEHAGLARVERAAVRALRDQQLQLLGVLRLVELGARVGAQQAEDPVRHRVQGAPRPAASRRRRTGGRPRSARDRLGVHDRVDLRHLLAERDVERRGDEVRDAERDRERHPVRNASPKISSSRSAIAGSPRKPIAERGHA